MFLFGTLIGIILYKIVQAFPKKYHWIIYILDLYTCFTLASYLRSNMELYTSFILGILLSQLFFIITNYAYHPFIKIDKKMGCLCHQSR